MIPFRAAAPTHRHFLSSRARNCAHSLLRLCTRFVEGLPGDLHSTNIPRKVTGAVYSLASPKHAPSPVCVAYSDEAAGTIGLKPLNTVDEVEQRNVVQLLAGNVIDSSWKPFAACYGGHQFGSWAGQLGDGRAITLGEAVDSDGVMREVQLKGAGTTPYSRFADGKAVLRSSLREFLASEAMHALNIPTTRAVSCVVTGEHVHRDEFYTGNIQEELGAVVCRVAPTFLRFGSLELAAANQDDDLLQRITEFTIKHWYPQFASVRNRSERYLRFLQDVSYRTASLIAKWQAVGFTHGVMNTDNMSLIGLTLDYGPYGFQEMFSSDFVPNTSDHGGRYRWKNQPGIGQWNVAALVSAFTPFASHEDLQHIVNDFQQAYDGYYRQEMCHKLGFNVKVICGNADFVKKFDDLVISCLDTLEKASLDYTNFWFALPSVHGTFPEAVSPLLQRLLSECGLSPDDDDYKSVIGWIGRYKELCTELGVTVGTESVERCVRTQLAANPRVIPRNFQMHAVVGEVEKAVARSQVEGASSSVCRIEAVEAYLHATSKPFASMSPHQYLEHARIVAVARTPRARNETWNWKRDPDAFTESLALYPHLSRKGVTFCSCSS